ncbi:type I restriction and modification enzyme subunit R-like protein [Maribacter caenipelagi]|uniref:Type I restriction and modification enzyme subunit R-like protein n=1 Tax=Maribacter caenipelagi TaxID=1447781 RepID=A0A4R7CZ67_9FLAO|nr:type I restriction enzyme HsdR N-terminal domain-containing protein [Maribacter caenipelagi]TDS13650.1 type I restriction and modification enzyme subunit R-like protein [Maribacter caenipelagi]
MQPLNFPSYTFRVKNSENRTLIFDAIRKKFLILTPEEWVRQHVVQFLIQEKKYPLSHINVEKQLTLNGLKKRYDVVVFKPNGELHILVECKAPEVSISQMTFDQIAQYNFKLNATYLMVTNGLLHYYCQTDFVAEKYEFMQEIPDFSR